MTENIEIKSSPYLMHKRLVGPIFVLIFSVMDHFGLASFNSSFSGNHLAKVGAVFEAGNLFRKSLQFISGTLFPDVDVSNL